MTPDSENPVNVLIVDDKVSNLEVLEAILKSPRYRLDRAEGGEEALKLLLQHEYACCLLDIRMPKIDGFQTAEFIRQDVKLQHLPIIFVTAEAGDQKSLFKGYEKGAIDFLIKPIEPFVLKSKVKVFAELYLQRKALERSREIELLNEKLEKLNQDLQSANSDLEHFTHMAAHDIKEPIRKQRNLVELLFEQLPNPIPEKMKPVLNQITRSLDQMLTMVEDFRALTKIDYKEVVRSKVNLRTLIEDCLKPYGDVINEKDAQIRFDVFPDEVSVYPTLVRLLYDNMIRNVLDHVHIRKFSILFTAEKIHKAWWFGVKNTGSSISKDQFGDIFKMYRKADRFAKDSSGIGLTICKKIVDRHNGVIKVESGEDFVHFKFILGDL